MNKNDKKKIDEEELNEEDLEDEGFELLEVLDDDEEDYEEAEDDDEEEYEEVEDDDEEEYEEVEDDDEEEYEEVEDDDEEEYEEVEDDDEEEYEEVEDDDEEEYEEVEDDDEEEYEKVEDDNDEETEEDNTTVGMYPKELTNLTLECIYLGLLFLNPKAISRFFLVREDCHFSDDELFNLYKIIIFREGEAYAPAIAKAKFNLPTESPRAYDLTMQVKRMASIKNYSLEKVYTELKKLFILKKNYITAPTQSVQDKILEIQHYELYNEMTIEEVESAIEQIGVTNRLSQVVLNENATSFLLSNDSSLSSGIPIPFPIISSVFKGLRKGETMSYAMPSNSGKSRFTVFLACHIALIHHKKVLIISNEMSEEKIRLCLITTIINNVGLQELHKQYISKTEGELLELKFRPDKNKKVELDEDGFILKHKGETNEQFLERLKKESKEFNQTIAITNWINDQINDAIHFIHITEHKNDELKKILLNYYYKEGIEYMFYDTLKTDTDNIGNGEELKKTATILSNIAQKFHVFIGSSLQLLESSTLPVNLTINDMSASKTVKEVLDTLCLIKQISRQTLYKYEYAMTDQFTECFDIEVPKDTDVRFYACVVDKNRAGAKPTVLLRLNLAYNIWEELGYLRLKQENLEE